ncbi:MAG: hypothetical protein H6718_33015 [Polyangiaceae bacterium]|nr:hypothetical protein [Myxococcales bacterium]MCB9590280.1 hypothetical protein [Polyangiaceae bacterium]MCB9605065.1 hypothetical protein [Polyangiaceae bacterium]
MRPSLQRPLLLLALGFATTGCFRVSYVDHAAEAKKSPGVEATEKAFWQHNAVFGIIKLSDDLDARDVCGAPPERVQTAGDLLTSGLSLITVGVYSPRKIYVTCPEPGPQRATAEQR